MIFWGVRGQTGIGNPPRAEVVTAFIVNSPFAPFAADFPPVSANNLFSASGPGSGFPAPLIFLAFGAPPQMGRAIMGVGDINSTSPPNPVTLTSSNTGILSGSVAYAGTWYAATAYQDVGTTHNTQAITFTYQGAEGGGGPAVGLRWSNAAQQGVFAFIDTNASPVVIKLYAIPGAWGTGSSATSASLSLTSGNSYTLVISDDGTDVTASMIDNSSLKSCTLTPTVTASNTEVMFGWVGLTASHAFSATITLVTDSIVDTPTIWPPAGTYANTQNVAITTNTADAEIYYTTNGSTPTTSSTLYTGPIAVATSITVKAIAVKTGAATSAVASEAFTINTWTMGAGTIDGATSGTITLIGKDRGRSSSSTVYGGTWTGATCYRNLGTNNNTVAVTFTYQGAEGGGGAACGLRWSNSSQQGDFAFINTNASPPVIALRELTSGWTSGTSAASSSLTLTAGNTYTLTITDDGTTVTAYLYDDAGLQTCNITPTLSTSNQEAMTGWIGLSTSFTFASAITGVATTIAATPTFSPAAGTYTGAQSVTLSSTTSGASIYYTTDGSTPTPLSLLYVGAINVEYPQTIKAIAVRPGYANSAVASAAYTVRNTIPVGSASTDGTTSTTLATTVDVVAGLVVVNVYSDSPVMSVTFDGTNMTNITTVTFGTSGNLKQYYYACSDGAGIEIVASTAFAANMQMEIVNVVGLTNNAPDNSGATVATNNGSSSTPSTGATPTSSVATTIAVAGFALVAPGGSITWGGTPTFIADGQDVSDTISSTLYVLTGAYYLATATGTFTAALSGITPTYWGGSVVVYS